MMSLLILLQTNKRYHDISTVLGETRVEDFPDGESDITFSVGVLVSDIHTRCALFTEWIYIKYVP